MTVCPYDFMFVIKLLKFFLKMKLKFVNEENV